MKTTFHCQSPPLLQSKAIASAVRMSLLGSLCAVIIIEFSRKLFENNFGF